LNLPAQSSSSSKNQTMLTEKSSSEEISAEVLVGTKLRELRNQRKLSLRALAERSGLNINTLSLIENGRISPSVSTLQQLARALEMPIAVFFETEPVSRQVVFSPGQGRPEVVMNNAHLANLGKDLAGHAVQPFVVTLDPGSGSGDEMVVHTGHEFVYCLAGEIMYQIEDAQYQLHPGDSLVFEAHLRHRWQNVFSGESQMILVFYPADQRDEPGDRHFQTS
jgi:quercetin dioxygenase-like cupin family protein/DNA-binding transcriptional regulator YiaG